MSTMDETNIEALNTPDHGAVAPEGSTATHMGPAAEAHTKLPIEDTVQSGDFPNIGDGDVLITFGNGMSWKLHACILHNASQKFRAMFDEHFARSISKKMREEGKTIKWVVEMVAWEENPNDTLLRSFRVVDKKSKPTFKIFEDEHRAASATCHKLYDNVFRCIYSLPPNIFEGHNEAGNYSIRDAVSLLQAAESLDAINAVRSVVEAHLLRLNQLFWSQVGHKAESWSDIAVRLQSPIIFRESMIHLVGRYGQPGGIKRAFLIKQKNGVAVFELVAKKAAELKAAKLAVERRLAEFYPVKMRHAETPTETPGRITYSNDIYLWQALAVLRQFITSSYMANLHHRSIDGGIHFYRCIGAGGDAYLNQDTVDRFHQTFAMSTKGKQCLAGALEYVKDEVRHVVADLLVDRSQYNRGPYQEKLGYFTCTEILDEELPWAHKEKVPHGAIGDDESISME